MIRNVKTMHTYIYILSEACVDSTLQFVKRMYIIKRIKNARDTVQFCNVVAEGDKKWRKMEDPETGDEVRITEPVLVFPGLLRRRTFRLARFSDVLPCVTTCVHTVGNDPHGTAPEQIKIYRLYMVVYHLSSMTDSDRIWTGAAKMIPCAQHDRVG